MNVDYNVVADVEGEHARTRVLELGGLRGWCGELQWVGVLG
jgi:hypothetical protein